jgi:hypothetical protein
MKSKEKMSKARGLTYISSDEINCAKQKKGEQGINRLSLMPHQFTCSKFDPQMDQS